MIITAAEFVTSAVKPHQYPPPDLPEIAFSGRSNVGKSSLINTLVNRKHLVKTSRTPGRTQLINFFRINQALSFVDLPGYGYARVPEAIRKTWGPMIETYMTGRESLRGVLVLMDVRRQPGAEESNLIDWLRMHNVPAVPVLTKADKFSRSKQTERRRRIADAIRMDPAQLVLFSAKTRQGKDAVWHIIAELCAPEPERGPTEIDAKTDTNATKHLQGDRA